MSDAEHEIRELLEEMADGYRAKDPERIVGRLAAGMVQFGLAPPLATRAGQSQDIGGGRVVDMTTPEGVATWLAGFGDGPFEYELKDIEVAVDGDVGFAYGLARMGVPPQFGLWFRLSVGVRRTAGRWEVAHLHASTPFYMDGGGRAALDLLPGG